MATKDQEKKNRDKELKDKTIEVNPDKTTKKDFGSSVKSNINQADQKKKIDDLLKTVKELQDKNLRLLAENENIRKINTREIQDSQSYAIKEFAMALLNVIDNFQRAQDAVPKDLPDDNLVKNLIVGFNAIEKELIEIFERNGIKKFASINEKFDPELHQAVSKNFSDKVEKGFIMDELQSGFKIADRLLRPAMVVVSEGKQEKAK